MSDFIVCFLLVKCDNGSVNLFSFSKVDHILHQVYLVKDTMSLYKSHLVWMN